MVTLARGQPALAAAEKLCGVVAHDLHGTVGPAEALVLVIGERVGDQTLAIAVGKIGRLVALLENAQTEFGVLGDAPFAPTADLGQHRAAHQRHGAVLDDRIAFVAGDHADIEKAAIFCVAHRLEGVLAAVPVVLRCLHNGDLRALEARHQIAQPVGIDDVVTVDHRNDLRAIRRARQRIIQGA